MRISVIGTGYLGATHAACLAELGHEVLGVDTDPERVERLARGVAPFHEPGLDRLLERGLRAGLLQFDTSHRRAAEFADVHFLCVGTPQRQGGQRADLSALWEAVRALAPALRRECLVVGKSTVPVGTASQVAAMLVEESPAGPGVGLAWNPEFLREGYAVEDSLRPDRLVFGVQEDGAYEVLCDVYTRLLAAGAPVVRTDLATAELAKVSANVMLAARLSVVNVLAEVCEAAHADVGDLIAILGSDPRIGHLFLAPGLGFGGGCLPKDLRAFVARAAELGLPEAAHLLGEVDTTNMRQRVRTVDLAAGALGDGARDGRVEGRRVTVLGAAFKAGSDDLRDSPALDVAVTLQARGALVTVHDPKAGDNVRRLHSELTVIDDAEAACRDAEVVVICTDWDEYRGLDPVSLADVVARPVVVDARLVVDPVKWRAAGWQVHALGRGSG